MSALSQQHKKLLGALVASIAESAVLAIALVVAIKLAGDDVVLEDVTSGIKRRLAQLRGGTR